MHMNYIRLGASLSWIRSLSARPPESGEESRAERIPVWMFLFAAKSMLTQIRGFNCCAGQLQVDCSR
ncbi:uncharacterized protein Dsimw501_GD28293 [Drosophila simulans]|uniref:Uncharacterized protein n=1 Tax=Drosophila simulans TaxID=7240 RepID=A0A0J9RTX0_DROSI|nr:uncharacterized protein Dsimw501_GD28293 [Drosophila simulans]